MTFEDFIALERKDAAKEAAEEAARQTQAASILELLEDYGPIPDFLREGVMAQDDSSVLKSWLKLAARSGSIQDFADKTGLSMPC